MPVAHATRQPRLLAAVSVGLKGALMESFAWDEVRTRLERESPDQLALFNDAEAVGWVPLQTHVSVVDVATDLLGEDAMRNLGRGRILGMQLGALFPNMIRSWIRSFAEDPTQMVQLGPHIWKAGTEECGVLRLVSQQGNYAHFRFDNIPQAMRSSQGWRAMMEGVALGVLELAGLEAEVNLMAPQDDADYADATVKWRKKA